MTESILDKPQERNYKISSVRKNFQLFFYVPCLTFDLLRLSRADKQQFSLMLFNSDIRQYKAYPSLTLVFHFQIPVVIFN